MHDAAGRPLQSETSSDKVFVLDHLRRFTREKLQTIDRRTCAPLIAGTKVLVGLSQTDELSISRSCDIDSPTVAPRQSSVSLPLDPAGHERARAR
jgi:hypothetical protein